MKFSKKGKKSVKQTRGASKLPNQKTARFSYYRSSGGQDDQDESQKRLKPKKLSLPVLKKGTLALVLIGLGIYVLMASFLGGVSVKVDNVETTTQIREEQEYTKAVDEFMKSSVLNRSKITFDNAGLISSLKDKFPEIYTANVSTDLLTNTLKVNLDITNPIFALETTKSIAIVGENGITLEVLDKETYNNSDLLLKRLNDITGVEPQAGKPAFPEEQTIFIATINEQLEKQGFPVESLNLTTSPYDLHVKLRDKSYIIKFNLLEDPLLQTGTLVAFIKNEESRGAVANEYIDLRVKERLFYK